MQISSAKNENTIYNFSGKKDEVEKQIKGFEEAKKLIDPAFNIVLEAEQYYDKGQYEKSLELTKDALEKAKSDITRRAAYRNLLGIYEATKRYDLAIQSIDWLLEHVNEYAKPDLLKKRAQLEKILLGSGKNHS